MDQRLNEFELHRSSPKFYLFRQLSDLKSVDKSVRKPHNWSLNRLTCFLQLTEWCKSCHQ